MDQILIVLSAEHVARYLFDNTTISNQSKEQMKSVNLTSGLSKHRVKYLECALNLVIA